MATIYEYQCPRCGVRSCRAKMFDVLRAFARQGHAPACSCGGPSTLRLTFDFQLGAGPFPCEVVAAFLPDTPASWDDGQGNRVVFYPFLVVTHAPDGERSVWLPYWHEVHEPGQTRTPFGQWAPFMGVTHFAELVAKAQAAGLL